MEKRNKKTQLSNKKSYIIKLYHLILIIAVSGLIVPYAAQFILPFFFPNVKISGIEIWNQYVSLILGIIAAIMSVISLVLCIRSESSNTAISNQIKNNLDLVNKGIERLTDGQKYICDAINQTNKGMPVSNASIKPEISKTELTKEDKP